MSFQRFIIFSVALLALKCSLLADHSPKCPLDEGVGVSSNPSPTDHIGTGYAANQLYEWMTGKKNNTGFTLEGLWILDGNQLISGGIPNTSKGTVNNLFQLELLFDPGKISHWKNALFSVEYLQLDGAQTNGNAGLVQGFEGLIQTPPLRRRCLCAWWYRQEWLNGQLITRIGKSTPNCDFNAVNRLFPMNDKRTSPAASSVIYGTIFNQAAMANFLPSYYNSAFGVSAFYFPVKDFYVAVGGYDGNKARGEQTGLESPRFNGYYFLISESGYSWANATFPGRIAVGAWKQTGKFTFESGDNVISQNGVYGLYLYGSQRLLWKNRKCMNSGIVTYWQLGLNNSKTLSVNQFLGVGFSFYGLVPRRIKDSFGIGLSLAGLNKSVVPNSSEWMFQSYYQCYLFKSFYLEPVLSYIPQPGAQPDLPPTWAASIRVLAHF